MPLDNVARSDGLEDFPSRFDASWTGTDPRDLAAIRAIAPVVGFNEDAESLYFARALDYVKTREYIRKRPPLAGAQLVPTSTDTPEGTQSVTYKVYDTVGMAKIIANYADDLPNVDVVGTEKSVTVRTIGDSYGYSVKDIRAANRAGTNLDARKSDAARNAVERKENSLKLRGDPPYQMFGITNHPNVSLVVPITGNWGAPATTGDQIVADFSALYDAIVNQSAGTHTPTVFSVGQTQMSALRSKRMTGDMVALQHLQVIYPQVRFVLGQEMKGAGAGGTDVAFMAEYDLDNYYYDLVKPFEQYPPQARNLGFVIPCDAETAGLIVVRPLALARMEGV